MIKDQCMDCGRPLEADEIAIYKRLISRGAESFMCIRCLSHHFNVDEKIIRDKIQFFKEQGCTLFPKD